MSKNQFEKGWKNYTHQNTVISIYRDQSSFSGEYYKENECRSAKD